MVGSVKRRLVLGLVLLWVVPLIGIGVLVALQHAHGLLILAATIGPPSLLFIITAVWHSDEFDPDIRAAKARRTCAACGYDLQGCRPDEGETPPADGCTTCPECGAAWRLPPPSSSPERIEP